MVQKMLTDFVLPLAIFPSLFAMGCKFMYADHFAGGLDKTINALCLPSSPLSPQALNMTAPESYLRKYTYIPSIDKSEPGPCHVVAFFHLLSDAPIRHPSEFVTYFFGTGLPCVLVILIEAYRYRGKQHWLLSCPTFWLLMTQAVTVGMTFPMFWLFLILSRGTRSREAPIATLVGPEEAQGLAFGLVFGAILPTITMILINDPYPTWVWQTYPIYVAILRALYSRFVSRFVTPKKTTALEGQRNAKKATNDAATRVERSRKVLRVIYVFSFLISSFMHIRTVWPLLWHKDLTTLAALLKPTAAPPNDTHPSTQALSFLKWDYTLAYSAFLLGLIWSARSQKQVIAMVLCYIIAVPVIGMGATAMIILCWRDGF